MVFQAQEHAALLSSRQNLFVAVDDPFKAVFVGVAGLGLFNAAMSHQVVEILARPPGAGVDPHGGNSHCVSQFNPVDRVLDVLLPLLFVRREKSLVGGKATQRHAVYERPPLEPLQIAGLFAGHLAMEDLDAAKSPFGGQVDALLDVAQLLVTSRSAST